MAQASAKALEIRAESRPSDKPLRIEFSPGVLEAIRTEAVDGLFCELRGGVEIGGILLGSFRGDAVYVTEHIAISHGQAGECAFCLSDGGGAAIADILNATQPTSSGAPTPAGWYRSGSRTGPVLTAQDLEFHRRFFPDWWQITVVVQPSILQASEFICFVPTHDTAGPVRRLQMDCGFPSGSGSAHFGRLEPQTAMPSRPETHAWNEPVEKPSSRPLWISAAISILGIMAICAGIMVLTLAPPEDAVDPLGSTVSTPGQQAPTVWDEGAPTGPQTTGKADRRRVRPVGEGVP
ncbi:MAG: hypothetical protein KJZ78_04000 [Bryobacteraceae bacterium]|nr:hypothetical protein [Bryobacteraceae bacterium]